MVTQPVLLTTAPSPHAPGLADPPGRHPCAFFFGSNSEAPGTGNTSSLTQDCMSLWRQGGGGVTVVCYPANRHPLPTPCSVAPRNSLGVGRLDVAQVIVHRMVEKPHDGGPGWGKSRRPDSSQHPSDKPEKHKTPTKSACPATQYRPPTQGPSSSSRARKGTFRGRTDHEDRV